MSTTRIVIYGNAGSGKTTMARVVAREFRIPHLSLDDICWASAGVRLPLSESIEFSLARHRAIFEPFTGPKREYREWQNPAA